LFRESVAPSSGFARREYLCARAIESQERAVGIAISGYIPSTFVPVTIIDENTGHCSIALQTFPTQLSRRDAPPGLAEDGDALSCVKELGSKRF